MSTLNGFPMVNQNTAVTSDGRVSENAPFDCVGAVICAMCMYLNGIRQIDHDTYNPDKFKDMAYGEALRNSGTAAVKYVPYCASLGVKLWSLDGEYPYLIEQAHKFLAEGKPVMFTQEDWIVDTSLPAYQGWTHVACWYSDGAGTLTSMDPWGGFPRMKSDAGWIQLLRAKEIWIAERIDETVKIDISTPGVSYFYEEVDAAHWKCKQTGHIIHDAGLEFYKGYGNADLCGVTWLGLPKTDEIKIETLRPPTFAHLAGKGIMVQFFECGVTCYDPGHLVDQRPGYKGAVYLLQLYSSKSPGQDPHMLAEIADLQSKLAQGQGNPQLLADMRQIRAISGKY